MNKHTAKRISAALIGRQVGGWLILQYINHGKSAVVFLAERAGQQAALKVFDPDIVDRYGREVQLNRINRELALIGKSHPHLVQIFDGGEDGNQLFVAMEYFKGNNLAENLLKVPPTEVRSLISQIASAAKFLEGSSFAHRDIKPENIGLSEDMKFAKLLDFGVLRPLDLANITDEGDQLQFIGTLQYSPPELLFREEDHSIEGWRAITFYQMGGVLHDLLMRKPLFEEFKNPYARLVRAVEREIPRVDSSAADADLRLLSQNCLAKIARQRLETVKWEDFSQPKVVDPMDAARRRVAQHKVAAGQIPKMLSTEDMFSPQCFELRTSVYSAVVNGIKTEGLPRYSLESVHESNPYLLKALFEPSPKDGLKHYFSFFCQGNVIDAAANLQEIKIWACVTQVPEFAPAEPDPNIAPFEVKGSLIEQDVRTHVQQRLLLAYAEALDTPTHSAPIRWLMFEDIL